MILTKQPAVYLNASPKPGEFFEQTSLDGRVTFLSKIEVYIGYRPGEIFLVKDWLGIEQLIRRNEKGKWAKY